MAEFNPDVQEQNMPDWQRTSKGTSGDTSMGTLFSGIGNAVSGVVQTGDNFVKNTIEDASRYSKESIDNEMGVNSQQYPVDLPASQTLLQNMTAAKNQGKISDEYYWQRMSNTMKGLRARFPGYEKEVDQIFSRVTGQNPANAFRDQLWSNISAAGAASRTAADKDADFVRNHAQYLSPAEQNDPALGTDQKIARINARQSQDYQAAEMDRRAKYDQNGAGDLYNQRTNQIAARGIEYINSALGSNSASFSDIMQRFSKGGTISPENKNLLNQALDGAIGKMNADMTQLAAQPGYNRISTSDASNARDKALEGLKQLKTMVNDGQYDQAAQLAASLNFQSDKRIQAAVQQYPMLGGVNAITKLAGPQAGQMVYNQWMSKDGGAAQFLDWTAKNFSGNIGAGIATGQMSMGDAAKAIVTNPGISDPKQRAQLVLSTLDAFRNFAGADFKQNPGQVNDFVKKVYGEDIGQNGLWRAVSDQDKITLYTQMFDPRITDKVVKSGDSATIQSYQNSAISYAQALPAIREAAGTTAEKAPFLKFTDVTFNPQTNRLEVTTTPEGQEWGKTHGSDLAFAQRTLGTAVTDLNRVVGVMAPLYKAQGIDPKEGVNQLLVSLGGNASPSKDNPNIFSWAAQQLGLAKKEDVTEGGNSTLATTPEAKGPELSSPEKEAGLPEISEKDITPNIPDAAALQKMRETGPISGSGSGDAMLSLIGRAEGTDKTGNGYNTSLANGALLPGGKEMNLTSMSVGEIRQLQQQMLQSPNNRWNSSAIGRYQVVGKTLQGLIDRGVVSVNDKFDEATQDKIAKTLIEDSGYSKWKAGQMSDAEFSRNLSGQWASLANTSGKTFYANQPRVGATAQEVLGAAQGSPDVGTQTPSSSTPSAPSTTRGATPNVLDPTRVSETAQAALEKNNFPTGSGMFRGDKIDEAYNRAQSVLKDDPSYRGPGDVYGAIPEKDSKGENQIAKFLTWNPDPVKNEQSNLAQLNSQLAKVYEKAKQDNPDLPFVIGVGRRDEQAQSIAKKWGWTKTMDSDHLYGDAMDVWPLNDKGQVVFEKDRQAAVAYAMKKAAQELGVKLDVGADWKSKDLPHFAVKHN